MADIRAAAPRIADGPADGTVAGPDVSCVPSGCGRRGTFADAGRTERGRRRLTAAEWDLRGYGTVDGCGKAPRKGTPGRRGAQGATGAGEGAALGADPEAGAGPEPLDAPCELVHRPAPSSPEAGASDDDSPEAPPSSPPERSEE